jgi:iron-sulfur cluster assembly protein
MEERGGWTQEGRCMIQITDTATAKVKEILEPQGKAGHGLRLYVRGMSCSGPAFGMALDDETRPDDTVADLGGVKVLVDPLSAPYLEGVQVDYVESLMGQGFTVTNPNQAQGGGGGCGGGCSCGAR